MKPEAIYYIYVKNYSFNTQQIISYKILYEK